MELFRACGEVPIPSVVARKYKGVYAIRNSDWRSVAIKILREYGGERQFYF